MEYSIASKAADNIRALSAAMVEQAKSGHPGGAMGGADFIQMLYSEFLNFDPNDPQWFFRDRFFLDPGHMSPMLYAQLALIEKFDMDELKGFRQWKSPTPGHPEVNVNRGIENTSGPLGQGHAMAVGAAITEKIYRQKFGDWCAHRIYTFISDGGIQEEISQGAGRIAGHLGLDNLIMFYDSNDVQLSTKTNDVSSEDTAKKYEAWGWEVLQINGNNANEIREALKKAQQIIGKPILIIGKTIMAYKALGPNNESMEGLTSMHGQPISNAGADFAKTLKNLGGSIEEPFCIFEDVQAYYQEILKTKHKAATVRKAIAEDWAKNQPLLAEELRSFLSEALPKLHLDEVQFKENSASRAASASVLGYLAKNLNNMVVSSADLSNSDKTDGFLKETTAIKANDFSGRFLNAGVSELTMASIMNGMALHGGIIPACGTFFVFSDYVKPALRLSALQELPVIYIWSHDAFRVGEDGPTHQPIEQLTQIGLMEKIYNHSGKRSMLVLRPADSEETRIAWEMALNNRTSPTGIILSRQNIIDLPGDGNISRKEQAQQAKKGGYIVSDDEGEPDMIFVASGSEVRTLYDGAELLRQRKKLKIRVVSVISDGLFHDQNQEYQNSIIPENKAVFGLTAGLPDTLQTLIGSKGQAFGIKHFGYSAPAKVLDEKFGFTAENVAIKALAYFENYLTGR